MNTCLKTEKHGKVCIIPDIVMNWEYKEQNMNERLSSPKSLRIFTLTKESDFLGKDPTLDRLQTVGCVSKFGIQRRRKPYPGGRCRDLGTGDEV